MSSVPQRDTTDTTTAARHLWETAVALAATRARVALPHSNGRIDKAMTLVLDGAVELLDDHSARVTSQTDGETRYYVVNGTCQCADFPHAPQLQCKHRIARGIAVRAVQIARDLGDVQAPQHPPQPTIPPQFLVEIAGKPFITYHGLLALATQQGLLSVSARFISVTADLAIAEATVMFHDGRTFTEAADATPSNVNSRIKPHFPRMALTRAKARALRDGLNLAYVCAEELD